MLSHATAIAPGRAAGSDAGRAGFHNRGTCWAVRPAQPGFGGGRAREYRKTQPARDGAAPQIQGEGSRAGAAKWLRAGCSAPWRTISTSLSRRSRSMCGASWNDTTGPPRRRSTEVQLDSEQHQCGAGHISDVSVGEIPPRTIGIAVLFLPGRRSTRFVRRGPAGHGPEANCPGTTGTDDRTGMTRGPATPWTPEQRGAVPLHDVRTGVSSRETDEHQGAASSSTSLRQRLRRTGKAARSGGRRGEHRGERSIGELLPNADGSREPGLFAGIQG